jgi:sialate O-acetylesterase
VLFHGRSKETRADIHGKWQISLDSEPAGGPFEFTVEGSNRIVLHDVLVGEVWVCSGQSNMEFELNAVLHAEAEILTADYAEIRHIKIPHAISTSPREDIQPAQWETCSKETAGNFTAVGYYFARELNRLLHVPVGLINSSWGGTMSETWTSRGAFEKSAEFKSMIAEMPEKDFDVLIRERQSKLQKQIQFLQKNIRDTLPEGNWKNPDYNDQGWPKISVARNWESQSLGLADLDGVVWYRKEILLDSAQSAKPVILSLGTIDDNDITYVNGIRVGAVKSWNQNRIYEVPAGVFRPGKNLIAVRVEDTGGGGGFYGDSSVIEIKTETGILALGDNWKFRIAKILNDGIGVGPNDFPSLLYNAMIHPLIPFAIRGVLWYQGEANADRAFQYRIAFPLMITDWRQHWEEGNFPFYFVQLASFNSANGNSNQESTWAELREAQASALSLPATGMSVTTDIGESNDIHPRNKKDVGLRLAAIALNNLYGLPMEYSGPVYESMNIRGNKIELGFTHLGSGLMVKDKYGYVRGFEIAGSDRRFYYAKAYIENNKVFVYSEQVQQPVSVHYNWADDAGDGNLYNREGFPALPFRTDQWKGITDSKKFMIGK